MNCAEELFEESEAYIYSGIADNSYAENLNNSH